MEPVILSCAELSTREINAALAALPDGASARVLEPRGRHNLAVGLSNRVRIDIEGNAGYFIGGLGDGPDVVVHGSPAGRSARTCRPDRSGSRATPRNARARPAAAGRSSSRATRRPGPGSR